MLIVMPLVASTPVQAPPRALVGPLPPPPHPLTIGGATPPWGKLPRDGWATSDIINRQFFCYFSFYFFAIFLDLHANILRDSARSYIWHLCYFCYSRALPLQSAQSKILKELFSAEKCFGPMRSRFPQ